MITIISVSDGLHHFKEPVEVYASRLKQSLEVKYIRPTKHTLASYIKKEETEKIKGVLRKLQGTVILCDERGKNYSSIEFSKKISKIKDTGNNIIFIIGGAFGVEFDLFKEIPYEIMRLSEFVFPHGLALLVLLEQVYRANEIIRGSGYHHE